MRIAVISDSHDNLPNLKKALDFIKKEKIKIIIHCGDISTPETLEEIAKNFKGKIHYVFGNADKGKFEEDKKEFGEIKIAGKKIAFCHFPEKAEELAKTGYDIVFYGHTHKPWEEVIGKTRLVNPGNLTGLWYKGTFAVYDPKTNKLELKILERL